MTEPKPSRVARLHQRLARFNTFLLLPMFTVMIRLDGLEMQGVGGFAPDEAADGSAGIETR